jgi:predicted ATPase/DNA-binding SARP family transcriptional activator
MAEVLQLKLFGGLRSAEAPLVLRPRAQRLLAYLLLHRHQAVPRQALAFTLWADRPEAEALAALRRALSEVRGALPAGVDWLLTAHDEVRWNPAAPLWLDAAVFEQRVREGTPQALREAVSLYSGDLLAGLDDDWVLAERERLRQRQIEALRRLAAHHGALGDYGAALDLTRRAVALDPLAEAPNREAIAWLYASGDRGAALAAYRRLRGLLWEELGVEPMAETVALAAAIAQGAALPAPAGTPEPAATPLPALIGREAEMDELARWWEAAAAGHGRFVLISGEAGLGKSHLALHLAERANRQGGLALVGYSHPFEHALPYQAIAEMLRVAADRLRYQALLPAHRVALARLAPEVMGVAAAPTGPEAASDEMRSQLYEALFQAFVGLARNRPLLLLFEDLHWAAESTLDWLTYLAPRLAESRVLVAVTFRTGEPGAERALQRLAQRLARQAPVSVLSLGPLSREAARALVAQFEGPQAGHNEALAERVVAEAGGNPFFLRELVRARGEASEAQAVDRGTSASPKEAEAAIPASLREAIRARAARLTETAQTFLQAAAVAGPVFRFQVVQGAGGWTDEAALEALEEALAHGLIRESEPADSFAFAHQLVQEVVYADLAAPRRAYWHRRTAESAARLAQRLPVEQRAAVARQILDHAVNGQDARRAFEWAALAAEHACRLWAYAEALEALEAGMRAFQALEAEPGFDPRADEARFADLALVQVEVLSYLNRPPAEQEQALATASELVRRHPSPRREAILAQREADTLSVVGQYERAAEAALRAHGLYLELNDTPAAAFSLNEAGRYRITISQNRAGRELLERSVALYQAAGDASGEALCLSGLAWSEMNLGEVEAALRHLNRAASLSAAQSNPLAVARTQATLAAAWGYYYRGDQVERCAQQALDIYRELGLHGLTHRPRMFMAEALRLQGDLAGAEALHVEVCARARETHDLWLEGWSAQLWGRLALLRGDLALAADRLGLALRLRQESGEVQNEVSNLAWLGRLHLAQGLPQSALDATRQAMDKLERLWGEFYVWEMPDVFMAHREALLAAGETGEARGYLQRAHETLRTFAGQILDEATREVYLAYPANEEVRRVWEEEA